MATHEFTPVGARFGRLQVIGTPVKLPGERIKVLCRCDCSSEIFVRCLSLAHDNTKSCGCLKREATSARSRTHGLSKSPTYFTYLNMVNRCMDPENKKFADYGGRGIQVCAPWLASFEFFLADMGIRPKGTTIDRKNTDGNYEPGNCRWATWKEQQNNKRSNRIIEFRGQQRNLAEWAEITGLSHSVIHYRLKRSWSVEESLTTPATVGRNQFT